MPEQYQGPIWILVEYKENNKYVREKITKPKFSRLPRSYNAIASGCIEGDSTGKCLSIDCEAMCILQCNFPEGNQSRKTT
jgi:hypothetical protein